MTDLHVNITGDCTSAVAALGNTEAAAERVNGARAEVMVTVAGTQPAIRGMQAVGAAREAAGGTVKVDVDSGGVATGTALLQGYRAEMRGAASDADGLSGTRAFGFSNDGSVRRMAGEVGQVGQGLQVVRGAGVGVMDDVQSGAVRTGEALQGTRASLDDTTASLGDFADAGDVAATRGERLGGSIGSANREVQAMNGDVQTLARSHSDLSSAMGDVQNSAGGMSAFEQGAMEAQYDLPAIRDEERSAGTGGGPPRRGGGGGGGGGGRGIGGLGGDSDPTASILGGAENVASTAMMPAMIGVGASALTAAVGVGSVYEAVQHLPGAMHAATEAEGRFSKGITNAVAGASVGVGQFQQLGKVLSSLGAEVGHVGLQNMQGAVGGITDLAGNATKALKALEPAIGPSISGMVSLGDAVMQGISSPQAVAGIKGVGETLSNPQTEAGIANIVSGLVTVGSVAATAVGDVASVAGAVGPGSQAGVQGGLAGAMMAKKGFPNALAGGAVGAGLMGWAAHQQSEGQDPTAGLIGGGLGAMVGGAAGKRLGASGALGGAFAEGGRFGKFGGPAGQVLGMVGGEAAMYGAGQLDKATGQGSLFQSIAGGAMTGAGIGMMFGPEGALIGAGVGALAGGIADKSGALGGGGGASSTNAAGFPQDPGSLAAASKYGWNRDVQGNLTPSSGPQDLNKGTPMPSADAMAGYKPPPSLMDQMKQPGLIGGPGTSVHPLSSQNAQLLGMNQSTSQLNSSVSTLGANASAAAPPLTQIGQHANTAGAAVTQLGQNAGAAMSPLTQIAPTVNQSLGQAAGAIQSGGQGLGQSVTSSMASGITANQGEACTAANQLGQSAVDCGAAALNAASPSKKFKELGEGTGQGFAIGVHATTGLATSAVGSAMTGAVGAGAAALGAQSPSKQFQALGAGVGKSLATANGQLGQYGGGLNQLGVQHNAAAQGADTHRDAVNQLGRSQQTQQRAQQDHAAQTRRDVADTSRPFSGPQGGKWADKQQVSAMSEAQKAAKQTADNHKALAGANADALKGRGFSKESTANIADRMAKHTEGAQARKANRDQLQSQAMDTARGRWSDVKAPPTVPLNQSALAGKVPQAKGMGIQIGGALGQGAVQGIGAQQGAVNTQAGNLTAGAAAAAKKPVKVNSPSEVFHDIGSDIGRGLVNGLNAAVGSDSSTGTLASGLAGAMAVASAGVQGVASSSGLSVGYSWAENVVTGAQSVIKKADYQSLGFPQIESQLAKAALGALGYLGPAGSGAQTYQTQQSLVTMGGSGPSSPLNPQFQVQVMLNSEPFENVATKVVQTNMNQLADSISRQRG